MRDFDDMPPGAPSTPEDRILGELIGTLADLKARYQTEGSELAWLTHRALSHHILQHEGPETWAQFREKLIKLSRTTLDNIHGILDEDDHRNRMQ